MTCGWIILQVNELNGDEGRAPGEEQHGVSYTKLRMHEKAYGNLLISKLVPKHNIKKGVKTERPAFNRKPATGSLASCMDY